MNLKKRASQTKGLRVVFGVSSASQPLEGTSSDFKLNIIMMRELPQVPLFNKLPLQVAVMAMLVNFGRGVTFSNRQPGSSLADGHWQELPELDSLKISRGWPYSNY